MQMSSNAVKLADIKTLSEVDRRDKKSNAATGASAAGVRALGSQLIALYLRAPAKAFFRTRVDVFDIHL